MKLEFGRSHFTVIYFCIAVNGKSLVIPRIQGFIYFLLQYLKLPLGNSARCHIASPVSRSYNASMGGRKRRFRARRPSILKELERLARIPQKRPEKKLQQSTVGSDPTKIIHN